LKITVNKNLKISARIVNKRNWFFYWLGDKVWNRPEKLMVRKTLDFLRDYEFFIYDTRTGIILSAYTRDYEYISYNTEEIEELTKTNEE